MCRVATITELMSVQICFLMTMCAEVPQFELSGLNADSSAAGEARRTASSRCVATAAGRHMPCLCIACMQWAFSSPRRKAATSEGQPRPCI